MIDCNWVNFLELLRNSVGTVYYRTWFISFKNIQISSFMYACFIVVVGVVILLIHLNFNSRNRSDHLRPEKSNQINPAAISIAKLMFKEYNRRINQDASNQSQVSKLAKDIKLKQSLIVKSLKSLKMFTKAKN